MGTEATPLAVTMRGAEFHRIISDERRLQMLTCLYKAGELEVGDMAGTLGREPAEIRQTLAELTASGLLSERRDRFRVCYRLADRLPVWMTIALGTAHDWDMAAAR